MISFLLTIGQFFRAIWRGMKDPEFRALFTLVVILLATGTWFYARVEGWSALDAFYFSVVTLTTIGYGDFSPTTPVSKIFTIFYILIGIGLLLGFVNTVTKHVVEANKPKPKEPKSDTQKPAPREIAQSTSENPEDRG